MKPEKEKRELQLIAVILFVGTAISLMLVWSIPALALLIAGGAIEAYLIYKGHTTITGWYVPIFPRQVDMPIAIIVPIALIVRAILIVQTGELNVYWVASAIALAWIVSHLCSHER